VFILFFYSDVGGSGTGDVMTMEAIVDILVLQINAAQCLMALGAAVYGLAKYVSGSWQ